MILHNISKQCRTMQRRITMLSNPNNSSSRRGGHRVARTMATTIVLRVAAVVLVVVVVSSSASLHSVEAIRNPRKSRTPSSSAVTTNDGSGRSITCTDGICTITASPSPPTQQKQKKKKNDVESSSSSFSVTTRGGGGATATATTPTQLCQLQSAMYFLIMDLVLRKVFHLTQIPFPSQLAGCILLFVTMVLLDWLPFAHTTTGTGAGEALFRVLSPGATLITKWLPVFFVPGLAGVPLAPSMGAPIEVAKVLGVVVLGFFFTLFTTTYTVLGLRKFQGAIVTSDATTAADDAAAAVATTAEEETTTMITPTAATTPTDVAAVAVTEPTKPKAFSDAMLSFLVKGTIVSAAISIGATRAEYTYRTPVQTIFLGLTTITAFVWGARFPPAITKFLHPILTSTGLTFVALYLTGRATGSTFIDVLKEYKCGSLHPLTAGAGDLILSLLGPAVISFSIAMYSRKGLLATNLPTVLTGMVVGSVGSLFGTAAFVRAIGLGGATHSCFLRMSTIPRNVTTALAMVIAKLLGGDISIAASLVVLTGMFAAMIGGKTLDAWGVTDPVARGLGIGAAGQSLGSASISHEKDAFPFAALNLVLVAVFATILASIPSVSNLLIQIACGNQ